MQSQNTGAQVWAKHEIPKPKNDIESHPGFDLTVYWPYSLPTFVSKYSITSTPVPLAKL